MSDGFSVTTITWHIINLQWFGDPSKMAIIVTSNEITVFLWLSCRWMQVKHGHCVCSGCIHQCYRYTLHKDEDIYDPILSAVSLLYIYSRTCYCFFPIPRQYKRFKEWCGPRSGKTGLNDKISILVFRHFQLSLSFIIKMTK